MKNWVNMQINTEISLKSLNDLYIVIKQKLETVEHWSDRN